MKVLKSHQFWVGVLVAVVLLGLFPQFNLVAKFKGAGKGPMQ